jgi:hypothetical protein
MNGSDPTATERSHSLITKDTHTQSQEVHLRGQSRPIRPLSRAALAAAHVHFDRLTRCRREPVISASVCVKKHQTQTTRNQLELCARVSHAHLCMQLLH